MFSSFKKAFNPPICTTVILVAVAAVIVLRKNATVKVLDMIVPVMAVCYFAITILIIVMNFGRLPGVFGRIFQEAFGFLPGGSRRLWCGTDEWSQERTFFQ